MNPATVSRLLEALTTSAGLPQPLTRTTIRAWRLSRVERLTLPDGTTAVFKAARPPFTREDRVLAHAAAQHIPVPQVFASRIQGGVLGILMRDLGPPTRTPTMQDAAAAAACVHAATPPAWLERLDQPELAALPAQALQHLESLRQHGRFTHTTDLLRLLAFLDRHAQARAAGAERPPFGLCHGELHPTAIHPTHTSWRVLDFAMALTGPGLLDLAAWRGLRQLPDPAATRTLIEQYVQAGGHPDALTDRGGLPAQRWALGWHRIHAATWLLQCATTRIDEPETDPQHLNILRRQLRGAVQLLNP